MFGRPVPAYLAGRTDAGVHAAGQVASLADYRPDLPDQTILKALNAHVPGDLSVLSVNRERLGFHARYDAVWREYRYRVWSGAPQPLANRYVWERRGALTDSLMNAAAARLVGTHDFASFAGGGQGVPWSDRQETARKTIRSVSHCSCQVIPPWWGPSEGDGQLLEIRIVADGFLPRMVRGITGALVEVGRGIRAPEWIDELIAGADRRKGPMSAPPHGLTLWAVGYGTQGPDAGDVRTGRPGTERGATGGTTNLVTEGQGHHT